MVDITTQEQQDTVGSLETEHGSHQRLEGPQVTQDRLEQPCVSTLEEQVGLRGSLTVAPGDQLSLTGDQLSLTGDQLTSTGDQQGSEPIRPQENQQGLEGIRQHEEQEPLDLVKPQGTQNQINDPRSNDPRSNDPRSNNQDQINVGQINDQEEKEHHRQVINEVIVSNVTEVSTSGEALERVNEETVQSESESPDMINSVFISTKLTPSQPQTNPAGRFSLQDLICGLLAQNQGTNTGSIQGDAKENQANSTGSATIAVQTDSTKQDVASKTLDERSGLELSDSCVPVNQEKKHMPSENYYDANSVALFLGEMAQRNGKKRRISSTSKGTDNEPKVVTLLPGGNQKCIILSSNEAKGAKFRKIQPKDITNVQEEVAVCEEEKEEVGESKGESQCRYNE
jgi:hypothetical protein